MMQKYKRKNKLKIYVRNEINRLINVSFNLPEEEYELSRNLIGLASNISNKTRIKIPKDYKRYICKGCAVPLIPGRTLRVRVKKNRQTHLTYTCLKCGLKKRYIIRGKSDG